MEGKAGGGGAAGWRAVRARICLETARRENDAARAEALLFWDVFRTTEVCPDTKVCRGWVGGLAFPLIARWNCAMNGARRVCGRGTGGEAGSSLRPPHERWNCSWGPWGAPLRRTRWWLGESGGYGVLRLLWLGWGLAFPLIARWDCAMSGARKIDDRAVSVRADCRRRSKSGRPERWESGNGCKQGVCQAVRGTNPAQGAY